ncbi:SDR family oxidoreductase [bacterium]|nr:SDR family oxidoreductase [bacterium]
MELKGRTCFITGGARRVGRAIALAFAKQGARVLIHYRSSRDEAEKTAADCAQLSGLEGGCFQADQADPVRIQHLAAEVDARFEVDVLVNSASVFNGTPFLETTPEEWDRMLGVNLRGPAFFCQAFAKGMIRRGRGVIINIADVVTETPWIGFLPYCVSKAALVTLTRGLARELAPAVRVNAIGPGTVLLSENDSEEVRRLAERSSLLGRIGSPEDVARACVFLVEGSDYITGVFLPVDGGKSLRRRGLN